MPVSRIMTDLKSGKYLPVYFLQGEEPYFIDLISDFIAQNALDEADRSFNQTVLYGLDTKVSTIVSEAKRFPMMAPRQVVIVREAQDVRDLLPNKANGKSELLAYVLKPQPTTVLVLCHKYRKLDGRTTVAKQFLKAVEKHGVVFTSNKVKDWNLAAWIETHVKELGYRIDVNTATLLAENLGNDLLRIEKDLGKLFIDLEPGGNITGQLIERNIGISKDYNVFELQNAILKRNVPKANRIILYFAANQKEHPIYMLVASLYGFFFKLLLLHFLYRTKRSSEAVKVLRVNPYFLKDYQVGVRNYSEAKLQRIIRYLRDADLKSKGIGSVSTDGGELLKELIFKIMH